MIGYLFVASDITDTRRSQEILVKALRREREVVARLKDLDRAKDDFVSTVSHELRTPMSSIIGSAEMLGDGHARRAAPRAAADGRRDLPQRRPAARPGRRPAGAGRPSTTTRSQEPTADVDLRAVVEESAHAIAADAGHPRPRRRLRAARASRCSSSATATHLERAITNLLTNAVKFTPDGGSVTSRVDGGRRPRAGRAQRHRHRARHPRGRPRGGLRPVLPVRGRPGARHPGLRARAWRS